MPKPGKCGETDRLAAAGYGGGAMECDCCWGQSLLGGGGKSVLELDGGDRRPTSRMNVKPLNAPLKRVTLWPVHYSSNIF